MPTKSSPPKTPTIKPMTVLVPEEEREAFSRAAESCGLNLSAWVRQICRAASGLGSVGGK